MEERERGGESEREGESAVILPDRARKRESRGRSVTLSPKTSLHPRPEAMIISSWG